MLPLDEIDRLMSISLNDSQLMNLIDNKANLILYPDLHKYNNIDTLLNPYGACVLLYESKPNYGHWTCFFKVKKNEIEFFNSYGDTEPNEGLPDGSLEFIPEEFREVSNQCHTYLSKLLVDSPYNLSYNQYKFQKVGNGINTCGRHVATRLNFRHLLLDDYYKFIKSYCRNLDLDPDEVVSLLTQNINKNE
jgi:hypothetical protein